jgi:predicted lactoylglutathione lyase
MGKMIFLNLPVGDIAVATQFYQAIGCARNDQYSDERSSSMVWSEVITFQLMTKEYFATFSPKKLGDAKLSCGMLIALNRESRSQVDEMVSSAAKAGGVPDVRPVMDQGWMYNRTFEDPDGHIFEVMWMDVAAQQTP